MQAPTVSIVTPTYNSSRTLSKVLQKVKDQDYDSRKIEIIVADGGSKDSTLKIAKKFGTKIIHVDPKKQNAEYNKGIGLQKATGDIVLFLDHDNIMPHNNWLSDLIDPFLKEPEIVGSEPLRFHYDSSMTLLDRYFSLFGGTDPVVYYFGKNSHLSWAEDKYNLLGKAKDKGKYFLVTFSKNNIPALGGNGAAFRRKILISNSKSDPDNFLHTDVVADLISANFNKYAIIKDSIIHLTNNKLFPFLTRRKYFIEKYQFEDATKRRYHVYDSKKDIYNLAKYILFSLTFVVPIKDSIKGFFKIRDLAWFLHPFMCIAYLYLYGSAVIDEKIKNV